jgi:hypothetical protein
MKEISENYIQSLKGGFLLHLPNHVTSDNFLDLQIRTCYLLIYYKGNSLLKWTEMPGSRLRVEIHHKFTGGDRIPNLIDLESTDAFLARVPLIKERIFEFGNCSLETEYEQLSIRANNQERRSNSEYFIVDRQYSVGRERFDLLGIKWARGRRSKGQTVQPCLMEIKFALNADISNVHRQLESYYNLIAANIAEITSDMESSFKQRLELGLYDQPANRLAAMKTLQISRALEDFHIILVLVDYNPHSRHLDLEKIAALPFADQVRIYFSGFAMWESRLSEPK